MRLTPFILLSLFISHFQLVYAQEGMVEIEASPTSVSFDVISMEENGFAVLDAVRRVKSRIYDLKVSVFNPDLSLKSSMMLPMDVRSQVINTHYSNGQLYLLTQKLILRNELSIIHINENFEFKEIEIPLFQSKRVQYFEIINDKALIVGLFELKPMAFLFNMSNSSIDALPGLFEKSDQLVHCSIDQNWGVISILTKYLNGNKDLSFDLQNYDAQGKLIRQHTFSAQPGYQLDAKMVSNFAGNQQMIAGLYSLPKTKGNTGVFHVILDENGSSQIALIPFYEMKNFYNHLPEKRAEKIKAKAKQRMAKKGRWSTSVEGSFFPIESSSNKFFLNIIFGRRRLMSLSHLMQVLVDENGKTLNTNNISAEAGNYRLLNSTSIAFSDKSAYLFKNEAQLQGGILGATKEDAFSLDLKEYMAERLFRLYKLRLIPWYDNKVLLYMDEGKMDNVGNVQRVHKVIPITIE